MPVYDEEYVRKPRHNRDNLNDVIKIPKLNNLMYGIENVRFNDISRVDSNMYTTTIDNINESDIEPIIYATINDNPSVVFGNISYSTDSKTLTFCTSTNIDSSGCSIIKDLVSYKKIEYVDMYTIRRIDDKKSMGEDIGDFYEGLEIDSDRETKVINYFKYILNTEQKCPEGYVSLSNLTKPLKNKYNECIRKFIYYY